MTGQIDLPGRNTHVYLKTNKQHESPKTVGKISNTAKIELYIEKRFEKSCVSQHLERTPTFVVPLRKRQPLI